MKPPMTDKRGPWTKHGISGFRDPRQLEYGLDSALGLALFKSHCMAPRRALILHEGESGSYPDYVLIDRDGSLWLYELKRDRMTRRGAANALCQVLSYADDYRHKSAEALAALYCTYMRRKLTGYNYAEKLDRRYRSKDPLNVLQGDFEEWFGSPCPQLGSRISRLVLLAPDWTSDAASLVTEVKSRGIADACALLRRCVNGKWVDRVAESASRLEALRSAEWVVARFTLPSDWITEEIRLGAAAAV